MVEEFCLRKLFLGSLRSRGRLVCARGLGSLRSRLGLTTFAGEVHCLRRITGEARSSRAGARSSWLGVASARAVGTTAKNEH